MYPFSPQLLIDILLCPFHLSLPRSPVGKASSGCPFPAFSPIPSTLALRSTPHPAYILSLSRVQILLAICSILGPRYVISQLSLLSPSFRSRKSRKSNMSSYAIAAADEVYNRATSTLTGRAWGPLVTLARTSVVSLLKKLEVGQLEIRTNQGVWKFGDPTLIRSKEHNRPTSANGTASSTGASETVATTEQAKHNKSEHLPAIKAGRKVVPQNAPHAVLIVNEDTFWVRMFVGADLGFAESFMSGEVDTPDLGACFELFIANRAALSDLSAGVVSSLTSWIQGQLNKRYANTRAGSLKNIGAHYDISNAMYEAFLSADMTYSSGVFPTLDADVTGPLLASVLAAKAAEPEGALTNGTKLHGGAANGAARRLEHHATAAAEYDSQTATPTLHQLAEDELEDAQLRKLRLHIERANIRKGDHVLEIGTGWGSFSMEAVRTTGCTVDSLTLSVEQKALAEQRIAAAGLSNAITVHLMDYRDMPASWADRFDRIVSIEMLEAVGIEFLSTYFACVDRVLKRRGGVVSIQCITMPEGRFRNYVSQTDFIRKWIFPGGALPSVTAILDAVQQGSNGQLVLDTAHSIGPHYSRTLREWRIRFENNFDSIIRPALLMDHDDIRGLSPQEQAKQVEVFRRKWICECFICPSWFLLSTRADQKIAILARLLCLLRNRLHPTRHWEPHPLLQPRRQHHPASLLRMSGQRPNTS